MKGFQLCITFEHNKNNTDFLALYYRQLPWIPHTKALEEQVNSIINILRRIASTTLGGSVSAMLKVHNALIKKMALFSGSSEERLQRLTARSPRVCLGVPRTNSSSFVIAEARHPQFPVMRTIETYGHFFSVYVQHERHPLAI